VPIVEITGPTTLRELLFDERGDAELAVDLTAKLPSDGPAARALSRERHLPKSAYRLLNSRITTLALQFLDQDIAGLVLSGLSTCRDLVRAAEDTRARRKDEVIVRLVDPYRFTAEPKPYIEVLVDEDSRYTVTFDLDLDVAVELCATKAAVRDGNMTAIDCTACALEVTFTVDGWTQPLVTRTLSVPVRHTLCPPVSIPLGPSVPVAHPPVSPVGRPPVPPSRRPRRTLPR
jgi:hypothetical protein